MSEKECPAELVPADFVGIVIITLSILYLAYRVYFHQQHVPMTYAVLYTVGCAILTVSQYEDNHLFTSANEVVCTLAGLAIIVKQAR